MRRLDLILQRRSPNEKVLMSRGGGGESLSFQEKGKKRRNVERFSFHLAWRCQVENVHLSPGDFYVRLGSWYSPQGVLFLACS